MQTTQTAVAQSVPMKKIRIQLRALTAVEYSEVLSVPQSMTDDMLEKLVNQRYREVDAGEFIDDNEYWERGHCNFEYADPSESVTGVVQQNGGTFEVTECADADNASPQLQSSASALPVMSNAVADSSQPPKPKYNLSNFEILEALGDLSEDVITACPPEVRELIAQARRFSR